MKEMKKELNNYIIEETKDIKLISNLVNSLKNH